MNIKNRIFSNFWIKISATLLSIALWAYIWGERKANNEIIGEIIQREFNSVPLAVLKDSLMIFEAAISHKDVSIVAEAERDIIEKLDRADIIAYIDIRGLDVGVYQLPPTWKVPLGIKIAASSPEFVTATIEDKRISEVKPVVESIPETKETDALENIKQ